ncbi:hypothetical protein [Roseibium salinum]|uniref:Uncharacterized protein n=1 Tax=Roseibium salinum TaxID=1604349 RepID=A0ABT3QXM5_9HYPH|nr:hypothetical protein [Roseibium sp. DSM 29163]MCX2721657.1 hypothetical protein [Roseibium sp. DSM 29163]
MSFQSQKITPLLITVLATSFFAAQATGQEKSYNSVRDCMRTVTKVENSVKTEDGAVAQADKTFFNRARDLCMQVRYEMVTDMLETVSGEDKS